MANALSMDLRERVLAAVASGVSGRQAGERFGVSPSSVSRWRARLRQQGDACPKAQGGNRRSHHIDAHKAIILFLLDETPDLTIEELRTRLGEKQIVVGYGGVRRFLQRHKITRKKRPPMPPSRTVPTS
jgi:transposase